MKTPKIIVVDDEQDIIEIYKNLLEPDFDVEGFSSPVDFLKVLENNPEMDIDLIVTDLSMPEMTGLEMIKQVQAKGFSFPFIFLSGHLDKKSAIEALNLGAFRLLEKPTPYETLVDTIDQLLMEHEIALVRKEIHHLTTQLRELYSSLRVIMSQYIPEDVFDRLVIETTSEGKVAQKMSFETVLEKLETRLERLLEAEKVLMEMKAYKPTK